MNNTTHLLVGCSFTDPRWQDDIPWSVEYSKTHPSYIVAQASMGIKGICTEAIDYLKKIPTITNMVILLPTLFRLDIELDKAAPMCNNILDLVHAKDGNWKKVIEGERKWICSGGLHYNANKKISQTHIRLFNSLYKEQGFLVIAKEHLQALKLLLYYCKDRKIQYYISTIKDPMHQLHGLDYIHKEIVNMLEEVEYNQWFRFDGKFVDEFLGHSKHPTTREHQVLGQHIIDITG